MVEPVGFTDREIEILEYMSENTEATYSDVAKALYISIATARTHLVRMRSKANVHKTAALIIGWREHRWGHK